MVQALTWVIHSVYPTKNQEVLQENESYAIGVGGER
jgi:hypothetical protein